MTRPSILSRLLSWLGLALPVDIIVPLYRNPELSRKCLDALVTSKNQRSYRIIIINDASPDSAMSHMIDNWCQQNPGQDCVVISHSENCGFTGSVNEGMQFSVFRDVVLLNSDAMVSGNWLDRMTRHLRSDPDIASITPFSNNATIASFPEICRQNVMPQGYDLQKLDSVFASANRGLRYDLPTAVGFCMYIRRAALRQVGLFDEINFPRGYGEENDFSLRAEQAGWRNVLAADIYIWHEGGVSFAEDAPALQKEHGRRLLSMYPDYDENVRRFIEQDPLAVYRDNVIDAMNREGPV